MKAKEAEKILLDDGWYFVKQVGSHRHYKHPIKTGKVTIPFHTCLLYTSDAADE